MGDTATPRELRMPLDQSSQDFTRVKLDSVIQDIISDHGLDRPHTESAGDFARNELVKLYDHPKVPQLEAILSKRITDEEARYILFFPDHDQSAYYQALIANPPAGAPAEHPQRAVQIPHLSLLYLQHWKRWEFVSAFVLAGGMHSLCSLFTHENPVVRMKAITTLVSITAHREFDWFVPPPRLNPTGGGGGVGGSNNTVAARLHRALLGLRSDPAFIPGLIANSWGGGSGGSSTGETVTEAKDEEEGSKTFPGGCLMCLELLAMWLSWVRALHTVDGTLRLSRPLFRAIKEWGGKEGEVGEGRGLENGQRIPVLPKKQQQQQERRSDGIADGEGAAAVRKENDTVDAAVGVGVAIKGRGDDIAAGTEIESQAASTVEGKGAGSTPETEKGKEITQARNGGRIVGKKGDREGEKAGDTASVATANGEEAAKGEETSTGERAPDDKVDAEATMLKAKREERVKVLELVEKLVADFGRYPPAEQEWEEVEEDKEKVVGGLCTQGDGSPPVALPADERAAAGPRCDDAPCSRDGGGGGCDNGGGAGNEKDESGVCGRGIADETLRRAKVQSIDVSKSSEYDTAENSLSAPTQKALALKAEGNEAFQKGNMEVARDTYTTALDILEAAAGVSPPPSPTSHNKTSEESSWNTSRVEAAVLRGVLHRNRAAVALRVFDSKATAAAAAVASRKDARATIANRTGEATTQSGSEGVPPRGRSVDSSNNGKSVDLHSHPASAPNKQSAQGSGQSPLPGEGNGRRVEEIDDARQALELSIALLEGCERDCLKAIEVNAGDKKARLRLNRCRELRRRCYRTGLASAAVDTEGRSTGYSRQDERLQGRKADLVAKILARTEGSHEIIDGVGGRVATKTTPASTAAAPISTTSEGNTGTTPSNSDSSGASSAPPADAKEVFRGCGNEGRDANYDSDDGGRGVCGNQPIAGLEGKIPPPSSCLAAAEDGAPYAPREGGELRRGNTRISTAIAIATAGAASAMKNDSQGEVGHREEGTSAPHPPPKGADGESGESGGGIGKIGGEGTHDTPSEGVSKTTKKTAVSKKQKKKDDRSIYGTPRSRPQINKTYSATERRSLRRRLEQAALRAATATSSLQTETGHGDGENAEELADGKEVWDILVSIPLSCSSGGSGGSGCVSLSKLFGDGITTDSLVGIARGLRHACRMDAGAGAEKRARGERGKEGWSSTERARELFLELAKVKRVGLVSAMCSSNDRLVLKDVSRHVCPQPIGSTGNGGGAKEEAPRGAEGRRRALALETAISTLGLL